MNEVTTKPAQTPATTQSRSQPSSPIARLRNEIDRLFDDFGFPTRSIFNFAMPGIAPAADFVDGDKDYRLTIELPGLDEKNVELSVTDGVLSVSGEKKEERETKEEDYVLSERRYGSFARRVALPNDVNADQIKAEFTKGVLTVILPKDEHAAGRTRKIAIAN